jgi:hypothetical protein
MYVALRSCECVAYQLVVFSSLTTLTEIQAVSNYHNNVKRPEGENTRKL